MSETPRGSSAVSHDAEHGSSHGIVSVHGVRYQVKDVARAVAFYTGHLGFTLEHQQLPAFASVSLGGVTSDWMPSPMPMANRLSTTP